MNNMPKFESVKDSGERRQFSTGAVRDIQSGKGRYDLLSPLAIRRIAKHYENGARKYGDRNWEKGIPQNSFIDSAIRHCFNALEGLKDEDHVAAAAWNVIAMLHQEEMVERGLLPKELMNLPSYVPSAELIAQLEAIKTRAEKAKKKGARKK
jgi:hypothetical protein